MATLGDEDVGGLDVAMDDALCMRSVERVGDFDADIKQDFQVHWTTHDEVFKGLTIEKFHGDERHTVLLVNLVDSANVGVVQSRGCLCLSLESRQCLWIFRDGVR